MTSRLPSACRKSASSTGARAAGPNHAPPHSKLLHSALETVARHGQGHVDGSVRDEGDEGTDVRLDEPSRVSVSGGEIVGFTFRFGKVTLEQLKDDVWRAGYLDAIVSVLAYTCGVEARNVRVTPPGVKSLWAKDDGGWQTALVEFPPARVNRGTDGELNAAAIEDLPPFDPDATYASGKKRKLGPDELLALLRDARDSPSVSSAHHSRFEPETPPSSDPPLSRCISDTCTHGALGFARRAGEAASGGGGGANRCVECDARGGKKTRDNASVTTTRFEQENRATT